MVLNMDHESSITFAKRLAEQIGGSYKSAEDPAKYIAHPDLLLGKVLHHLVLSLPEKSKQDMRAKTREGLATLLGEQGLALLGDDEVYMYFENSTSGERSRVICKGWPSSGEVLITVYDSTNVINQSFPDRARFTERSAF